MFKTVTLILIIMMNVSTCIAQHDAMQGMPEMHENMPPMGGQMPAMQHPMQMQQGKHEMMNTNPIGISHSRFASGTSWMPDSTPMYGVMGQVGKWDLMAHGALHFAWDRMNGPRGDTKFVAPNWGMLMARSRSGARGEWRLSAMVSLDALTVGGEGYPLLFQTGESWLGQPLKDHQHPHNLFSELSATYTHALNPDSAVYAYLAPAGEPALGPPTYMHRTFAFDDPLAPIGHHWQDSTHVTFGVATAGYQTRRWQIEFSDFTGREPGENRYIIQKQRFDSYSGRITYNPCRDVSMQFSHGYLTSPEELSPEENIHRTTASVVYNHSLGTARNFQTTFVWGRNTISGRNLDSYLIEAELKHDGGWSPYMRYEHITKDAHELVLPSEFPEDQEFNLQQATIGIVRDIFRQGDFMWGLGAQAIFNFPPNALEPVYGNNPTGWLIYLRVQPRRMNMSL